MNETFKEKYEDYIEKSGDGDLGYQNYLIERFIKDSTMDLIDHVREEYKTFEGKFILEIRKERIKGIYKSPLLVRASVDEPLRRNLFDRFMELTHSDDVRVEINLNCMI